MKGIAKIAAVLMAGGVAAFGQPDFPLPGLPGGGVTPKAADKLTVRAVPSHTQVTAGQTFSVAVDIQIAEGWVYYSPAPGDNGELAVLAAKITVEAGRLEQREILWPPHSKHQYRLGGKTLTNNVYEGRAVVYVPLTVPPAAGPGRYEVLFRLGGQICGEDRCLSLDFPDPVTARSAVTVGRKAIVNPEWEGDAKIVGGLGDARPAARLAEEAGGEAVALAVASTGAGQLTVWGGLGLALLAGLILNVMPCVLPVIPLRILSIVNMARESRRRFVTLGLAFAGGILLFFVAVGMVNVALRTAAGRAVNVSDHFQYPAVRIAIGMILVALAANLFGVFHVTVPAKIAALGGSGPKREGHLKSLGMGFMMAVLATPCSFWLLALALAWAQLQPIWLGTLAILLIGVGMAGPHAVLAGFPDLLRRLPRPGRWMELLKQTMGFCLLGVAIWLISTLSKDGYPFWVAGFGVVVVFALWVGGQWVRYDASLGRKLIVRGGAAALAVGAGIYMLRPATPLATKFAPYDAARVAAARQDDRPVLIKFTAAWCLSCLDIERSVYGDDEVARELAARNVLAVKADVTDRQSPAAGFLRQIGGAVPLTVIYPPGRGGRPVALAGKFDKAELIDALRAVGGKE